MKLRMNLKRWYLGACERQAAKLRREIAAELALGGNPEVADLQREAEAIDERLRAFRAQLDAADAARRQARDADELLKRADNAASQTYERERKLAVERDSKLVGLQTGG